MRGTFANVRIKNLMIEPQPDGSRVEGGVTIHQPSGERMSIYDAAMRYRAERVPTIVFGGEEYGTGFVARLGPPRARSCWECGRSWHAASSAFTAAIWSEWACCRCSSAPTRVRRRWASGAMSSSTCWGSTRRCEPRQKGHAGHSRAGRLLPPGRTDAADRHADRSRLLPPRRHSAVRAAPAAVRTGRFVGARSHMSARHRSGSGRNPLHHRCLAADGTGRDRRPDHPGLCAGSSGRPIGQRVAAAVRSADGGAGRQLACDVRAQYPDGRSEYCAGTGRAEPGGDRLSPRTARTCRTPPSRS